MALSLQWRRMFVTGLEFHYVHTWDCFKPSHQHSIYHWGFWDQLIAVLFADSAMIYQSPVSPLCSRLDLLAENRRFLECLLGLFFFPQVHYLFFSRLRTNVLVLPTAKYIHSNNKFENWRVKTCKTNCHTVSRVHIRTRFVLPWQVLGRKCQLRSCLQRPWKMQKTAFSYCMVSRINGYMILWERTRGSEVTAV